MLRKYRERADKRIGNEKRKIIGAVVAAALMQCLFTVPSFAYFNRGTVSMQLGQSDQSRSRKERICVGNDRSD